MMDLGEAKRLIVSDMEDDVCGCQPNPDWPNSGCEIQAAISVREALRSGAIVLMSREEVEALRKVAAIGDHKHYCKEYGPGDCDCGLAEALAALDAAKKVKT